MSQDELILYNFLFSLHLTWIQSYVLFWMSRHFRIQNNPVYNPQSNSRTCWKSYSCIYIMMQVNSYFYMATEYIRGFLSLLFFSTAPFPMLRQLNIIFWWPHVHCLLLKTHFSSRSHLMSWQSQVNKMDSYIFRVPTKQYYMLIFLLLLLCFYFMFSNIAMLHYWYSYFFC